MTSNHQPPACNVSDDVRYITPRQYGLMVRRLGQARRLIEKARNPNLTLAEKLDLQRQAKALQDEARSIGK